MQVSQLADTTRCAVRDLSHLAETDNIGEPSEGRYGAIVELIWVILVSNSLGYHELLSPLVCAVQKSLPIILDVEYTVLHQSQVLHLLETVRKLGIGAYESYTFQNMGYKHIDLHGERIITAARIDTLLNHISKCATSQRLTELAIELDSLMCNALVLRSTFLDVCTYDRVFNIAVILHEIIERAVAGERWWLVRSRERAIMCIAHVVFNLSHQFDEFPVSLTTDLRDCIMCILQKVMKMKIPPKCHQSVDTLLEAVLAAQLMDPGERTYHAYANTIFHLLNDDHSHSVMLKCMSLLVENRYMVRVCCRN